MLYNLVTHVFRFSWQLFICFPWQPVHSNSAISLATMKRAKICLLKRTKIHIYVNKKQKNKSNGERTIICIGFCLLSASTMFFTRHGRPLSNHTANDYYISPYYWLRPFSLCALAKFPNSSHPIIAIAHFSAALPPFTNTGLLFLPGLQ